MLLARKSILVAALQTPGMTVVARIIPVDFAARHLSGDPFPFFVYAGKTLASGYNDYDKDYGYN